MGWSGSKLIVEWCMNEFVSYCLLSRECPQGDEHQNAFLKCKNKRLHSTGFSASNYIKYISGAPKLWSEIINAYDI